MRIGYAILSFMTVACITFAQPCAGQTIKIGGSGGGLPLMAALGEAFARKHPEIKIEIVPSLGSAGGIAAVNAGAIDIAVSWRKLNAKEQPFQLVEVHFLDTPYVFATSRSNGGAIARADLVNIYGGAISKWPDGSPLRLILRPKTDANSIFLNANVQGMPEAMEQARKRMDLPTAATDGENIKAVAKIDGSFAGISLLQLHGEPSYRLKALVMDQVAPSVASMKDGSYPFTLNMFLILPRVRPPAVANFLSYLGAQEAETLIESLGGVRRPIAIHP